MLHLWILQLPSADSGELASACEAVLDEADRRRRGFYQLEPARQQFVIGRGLARVALSSAAPSTSPSSWRFALTAEGKPVADHGPSFSLAHTRGLMVCAVNDAGEVGADAEMIERELNLSAMTKVLTEEEAESLADMDMANRLLSFARIWTAKEAAAKACGQGLRVDFRQIRLTPASEGWLATGSAGDWVVWQKNFHASHMISVATREAVEPICHALSDTDFLNVLPH